MRAKSAYPETGLKPTGSLYQKPFKDPRAETARLIMMVGCDKRTKPSDSPNPELNSHLRNLRSFLTKSQDDDLASFAVTQALGYFRLQNSVYKWTGIAALGVIPIPKGCPDAETAGELLAETIEKSSEHDHVEAASFAALAIKENLPPAVRKQIDAAFASRGRGK
ncbi:MAG TPA: hypothetical protein VMT55_04340 [Candidatus Sulfotelmatobacter sp.]|nr:hypothetical protein [Candidatus Sulfotelmatobacter sp.]